MSTVDYFGPAILTLAAWAGLLLVCTGLGQLALRAVTGDAAEAETPFTSFWVGVSLTLAWLQIWSLWLPVGWPALVGPAAVAVGGWLSLDRVRGRELISAFGQRHVLLGLLALGVWGAVTAQAPLTEYDAGTYHLEALRWASTYPVTPGLGNLNPALGLGSSLFLYLAAVSVGGVSGFHIGIGLLLVVLLVELVASTRTQCPPVVSRLSVLMIMPTLVFIGIAGMSTTMYDAGSFVLSVVLILRLVGLLDRPTLTRRQAIAAAFVISTLAFATITVKIANAPFAGVCAAIVLGTAVRKARLDLRGAVPLLFVVASVALVELVPWMVRNVVLTGYPLYPLSLFPLPYDWTMPEATVQRYRDVLSDFARVHGPGFEGASRSLAWLPNWIVLTSRDAVPAIVIGVAAPLAMVLFARRALQRVGERWLILASLWVGLIAWFVTAPDPRYAAALLWMAAAVPIAFWLMMTPRLITMVVSLLFLAVVEMPNASYVLSLVQLPVGVATGQFAEFPDVPMVELTVSTSNSGLQVYGPPQGTDQIWDAPLPASFWPIDPNLHTRCPGSLACGFSVR